MGQIGSGLTSQPTKIVLLRLYLWLTVLFCVAKLGLRAAFKLVAKEKNIKIINLEATDRILFAIRHGKSVWNDEGALGMIRDFFKGKSTKDAPLTPEGIQDGLDLRDALADKSAGNTMNSFVFCFGGDGCKNARERMTDEDETTLVASNLRRALDTLLYATLNYKNPRVVVTSDIQGKCVPHPITQAPQPPIHTHTPTEPHMHT